MMPQAFGDPKIPLGTLTVEHTLVQAGSHSQLAWQIQYPTAAGHLVTVSDPGSVTGKSGPGMSESTLGADFSAQPVVVRINPQSLAKLQQINPMDRLLKPAATAAKDARPHNPSIIRQSTVLHDGENWTLVPNGAVILQPATLKARVNHQPAGTLLPWTEFLTKNGSWITTCEVTIGQAAGTAPLPPVRLAFWTQQDKIVIAVHHNGPISVRVPDTTRPRTQP